MIANIQGKFMEQKERISKKTGESIPVACIYSGGECVDIVNLDLNGYDFGDLVNVPVSITCGNYGLYIRVVE